MNEEKHIASVSGGKDSTALLILAKIERGIDITPVFADTGHEHPETYKYLDYLETKFGEIIRVSNNFDKRIANKRKFIANDRRTKRDKKTGRKLRWTNKAKRRALEVLHPTGNQMLDLCLWKGRFASTRRRFCSEQLKHEPIRDFIEPYLADGITIISWQGVRADESLSRKDLDIVEEPEEGLITYRPIITYSAQDVFDLHRKHNIKWNPLYEQGMGRVGCMPCIHARKGELAEIAKRWPEVIDYLNYMEDLVSRGSKRGNSTFYDVRVIEKGDTSRVTHQTHGIRQIVEWSKTTRGGHQYDLISQIPGDLEMCSSIYGLCESAQ